MSCRFPGSDFAWNAVNDVTDVNLLSDATIYLSTHKACENQAYNISNGDVFRWKELWPKIAKHFDMETGPNLHISLVTIMGTPEKEKIWADTVKVTSTMLSSTEPLTNGRASHWPYANNMDQHPPSCIPEHCLSNL